MIFVVFTLILLTMSNSTKFSKYSSIFKWCVILMSILLYKDLSLFLYIKFKVVHGLLVAICVLFTILYQQDTGGVLEITKKDYIKLVIKNVLYIPIYEELFYRYFIFNGLLDVLPLYLVYIFVNFVFVINHTNIRYRYFYLIPISIGLSIIYYDLGIAYSIILHIIVNILSLIKFSRKNLILIKEVS